MLFDSMPTYLWIISSTIARIPEPEPCSVYNVRVECSRCSSSHPNVLRDPDSPENDFIEPKYWRWWRTPEKSSFYMTFWWVSHVFLFEKKKDSRGLGAAGLLIYVGTFFLAIWILWRVDVWDRWVDVKSDLFWEKNGSKMHGFNAYSTLSKDA